MLLVQCPRGACKYIPAPYWLIGTTLLGVHPTSYPMGTGALSQGVKRPGHEADHSPPTSAEGKELWIYTLTPLYVFMA
jgi:hypothetical protein